MELKRFTLIFVFIALALTGCKRTEAPKQMPGTDFESLMGKDLPDWKYVHTPEDFANLAFFKGVYEKNISWLEKATEQVKVPKVIHFIWIGPKSFPIESIENVRSWIGFHPDWKVKFWTDRERALPHPEMELCRIQDLDLIKCGPLYRKSDNYGEMSDLLRLEILYKEGGIYVDHDVQCLKSFELLNKAYDFFCGMEVPFPSTLSSSLTPTNNTLGSIPGHPLIMRCMEWLEENWDRIEEAYPGRDRDSTINRVSHRTFFVTGEMFKKHANQGTVDIAFPSYYFNSPKDEWALFAQHKYKGTWFENESPFEKMAKKRLMYLSKKANKLLLAVGILGGLNLLGFGLLGLLFLRLRKAA